MTYIVMACIVIHRSRVHVCMCARMCARVHMHACTPCRWQAVRRRRRPTDPMISQIMYTCRRAKISLKQLLAAVREMS